MMRNNKKKLSVVIGSIGVAVVLIASILLGTREKPSQDAVSVLYTRTDGYVNGAQYPQAIVIRSAAELKAYYEANKDTYSLGRRQSASSTGFLDACDKYDDAYFQSQSLVLVLLEEGSGSVRHQVTKVEWDGGIGKKQLQIHIERKEPGMGTCDMAVWHLFIELPAGMQVPDENQVVVYIDGIANK